MDQIRIILLNIGTLLFVQQPLRGMDLVHDGLSLLASSYIVKNDMPRLRTLYHYPSVRTPMLFGNSYHIRPSIPACGLALCALAELYAKYFPKGKGAATIKHIQKKHSYMYQGSKMVMALPLIRVWAQTLSKQGTQVLSYAADSLLAPLSLYLAGSQWAPAARKLRDHIFLHRKKQHRRSH